LQPVNSINVGELTVFGVTGAVLCTLLAYGFLLGRYLDKPSFWADARWQWAACQGIWPRVRLMFQASALLMALLALSTTLTVVGLALRVRGIIPHGGGQRDGADTKDTFKCYGEKTGAGTSAQD
jgi:hypothetical protein